MKISKQQFNFREVSDGKVLVSYKDAGGFVYSSIINSDYITRHISESDKPKVGYMIELYRRIKSHRQ